MEEKVKMIKIKLFERLKENPFQTYEFPNLLIINVRDGFTGYQTMMLLKYQILY